MGEYLKWETLNGTHFGFFYVPENILDEVITSYNKLCPTLKFSKSANTDDISKDFTYEDYIAILTAFFKARLSKKEALEAEKNLKAINKELLSFKYNELEFDVDFFRTAYCLINAFDWYRTSNGSSYWFYLENKICEERYILDVNGYPLIREDDTLAFEMPSKVKVLKLLKDLDNYSVVISNFYGSFSLSLEGNNVKVGCQQFSRRKLRALIRKVRKYYDL